MMATFERVWIRLAIRDARTVSVTYGAWMDGAYLRRAARRAATSGVRRSSAAIRATAETFAIPIRRASRTYGRVVSQPGPPRRGVPWSPLDVQKYTTLLESGRNWPWPLWESRPTRSRCPSHIVPRGTFRSVRGPAAPGGREAGSRDDPHSPGSRDVGRW